MQILSNNEKLYFDFNENYVEAGSSQKNLAQKKNI